jgi:hypothetical protein
MMNMSDIVERLSTLPQHAAAGSALAVKGSQLTSVVMLVCNEHKLLLRIEQGVVQSVSTGPHVMPSFDFSLSASEPDWQLFLSSVPPPGSHDLIALLRRGALELQGNLYPLMSHLMYFKLLFESLRTETSS